MAAGEHVVAWDATGLTAGTCVVRMRAGTEVQSLHVLVAR